MEIFFNAYLLSKQVTNSKAIDYMLLSYWYTIIVM